MVLSSIVPDTSNTIILGPEAITASLKDPGPESFKLITWITLPPRPPVMLLPAPNALGNAFNSVDILLSAALMVIVTFAVSQFSGLVVSHNV